MEVPREKEGGGKKNVAGFTYPKQNMEKQLFFLRLVTQTRLECRGSEVGVLTPTAWLSRNGACLACHTSYLRGSYYLLTLRLVLVALVVR